MEGVSDGPSVAVSGGTSERPDDTLSKRFALYIQELKRGQDPSAKHWPQAFYDAQAVTDLTGRSTKGLWVDQKKALRFFQEGKAKFEGTREKESAKPSAEATSPSEVSDAIHAGGGYWKVALVVVVAAAVGAVAIGAVATVVQVHRAGSIRG